MSSMHPWDEIRSTSFSADYGVCPKTFSRHHNYYTTALTRIFVHMLDTIELKEDWDHQIKLSGAKGCHIPRSKEHRILVDFLKRSDEGAMLLCGHRGTGKTSSVIAAILDAQEHDKSLISILIKSTTLNFKHGNPNNNDQSNNENAECLLNGLIRSLHEEAMKNEKVKKPLRRKTETLYVKSLAEISEEHVLEFSKETRAEIKTWLPVSALAAALTGVALAGFMNVEHLQIGVATSIITAVYFAVTIVHKWRRKYNVRHHYRHTYTFSEKNYEFEKLMKEYTNSEQKFRIVFILDEFDKIGDKPDKQDRIYDIVHPLKMLINQGGALFIFVAHPDIMDQFTKKREKEYTLFSQVQFLKRPLFNEMEEYIDNIVDKINDCRNKRKYRDFQNYLCYKSQTDFFMLKKVINDHISLDNPGRPTIKIALDRRQITQANLQKAIGYIYERYKDDAPSYQKHNDEMLDVLYDTVEKIQIPNQRINVEQKTGTINYYLMEDSTHSGDDLSMVTDLFLVLTEQGYLKDDGGNDDNHGYTVIGDLPKFNDENRVSLTHEKLLKDEYEEFREKLVGFANIHSKWVDKLETPFSPERMDLDWNDMVNAVSQYHGFAGPDLARDRYRSLVSKTHEYVSRTKLIDAVNDVRNATDALNRALVLMLGRILEHRFDVPLSELNNTDDHLFARLKIPHSDIDGISLDFRDKQRNIENILVINSPPEDVLQKSYGKAEPNNNIVCVVNYKSVEDNLSFQIQTAANFFERDVIDELKSNQTSDHSGQQDMMGKIFFFGFNLLNHDLEGFIDVINRQFRPSSTNSSP